MKLSKSRLRKMILEEAKLIFESQNVFSPVYGSPDEQSEDDKKVEKVGNAHARALDAINSLKELKGEDEFVTLWLGAHLEGHPDFWESIEEAYKLLQYYNALPVQQGSSSSSWTDKFNTESK